MPQYAPAVVISARQREILERLVRARTVEQRVVERARIVLWSEEGMLNVDQAAALGVDKQRVGRWRRRWATAMEKLIGAEEQGASDDELEELIVDVLGDNYRSGTPGKFTAEQVAQLIALACEQPSELDLPVTHWTPTELAREATKRGIVDSISPRHVARFFGGGGDQTASFSLLAQSKSRRRRRVQSRGA